MIASANVLTDLYLSAAALIGLSVLHWHTRPSAATSPLSRRFLFVLRVGMLLFIGRMLVVLTGGEWFRFVVLLAAALIPLATLLLTESMLRRHAPLWVKAYVGIGVLVFGVLAFWIGDALDPARLFALLGFQIGGFVIAGWLIIFRDRGSLSVGENRTAHRLLLALLLLIPLGASDFFLVAMRLPVQFSAIGVLLLCWFALGLSRVQDGHRRIVNTLAVLLGAALLGSGLIIHIADFDRQGAILVVAINIATLLVLAITAAARDNRSAAESASILSYLAQAQDGDVISFLQGLSSYPLMNAGRVLSQQETQGLEDHVLTRIFTHSPVLRSDMRPALGPVAEDHMTHLFDWFQSTHLLDLATTPRQIVAVTVPAFLRSHSAEVELQAVQRMAALIARKDADHAEQTGI